MHVTSAAMSSGPLGGEGPEKEDNAAVELPEVTATNATELARRLGLHLRHVGLQRALAEIKEVRQRPPARAHNPFTRARS